MTEVDLETTRRTSVQRTRRYIFAFVTLGILLLVLTALNIGVGSVSIPLHEMVDILFRRAPDATAQSIVWEIRLPRMCAAIVLGGALGLAGFLLQTFFNNPIAGPFILGISSGSQLAVAILMVFFLSAGQLMNSAALIFAAFIGAMASMGFVLLIATKVNRASMLILCGVMIGYICSAVTNLIVTFSDDANIVNLHYWSLGSFSGTSWPNVRVMTVVVLVASLFTFLLAKPIGAYQLGEAYAQNMGVNIRAFRVSLVLLSSLLAACVTAFAGPVSFVGVAVPHLVKALLKTAKPIIVIPACFLGGAIFCLGCDLLARTLFAPTEVSISSVTAVLGAPVVIAIMLRKKAAE